MKKLIALFLALLLVFSLATVCFADMGKEDGDSPVGGPDIPVGPPDENPENPVDNSLTSPDTGVCAVAMLALVAGFAGVAVSGKKLFD